MKNYMGKTVEEAVSLAVEELQIPEAQLIYSVQDKKKGLFSKKVVIDVYEMSDIVRFAEDYILGVIDSFGIESSVKTRLDDDIIHITIDSTHNPILIGKNGVTLQALNELAKLAVNNRFKRRFRILLDINGYKNKKYFTLEKQARRFAHEVQKSKETYTFAPMPADERRAIHQACSNMPHIKNESTGEGTHRQVQIIYVD